MPGTLKTLSMGSRKGDLMSRSGVGMCWSMASSSFRTDGAPYSLSSPYDTKIGRLSENICPKEIRSR